MIDDQDSGEFPNLDITGLSFTSSDDIRMRALSNPQQFVADLLAANDTLIGSPGADKMLGFAGNDTYFVNNTGDVVVEAAANNADTVIALTSYNLTAGV